MRYKENILVTNRSFKNSYKFYLPYYFSNSTSAPAHLIYKKLKAPRNEASNLIRNSLNGQKFVLFIGLSAPLTLFVRQKKTREGFSFYRIGFMVYLWFFLQLWKAIIEFKFKMEINYFTVKIEPFLSCLVQFSVGKVFRGCSFQWVQLSDGAVFRVCSFQWPQFYPTKIKNTGRNILKFKKKIPTCHIRLIQILPKRLKLVKNAHNIMSLKCVFKPASSS